MSNKAIPVALAAVLMLGLAGCADNREEVQGGGGGGTTSTTTTTTTERDNRAMQGQGASRTEQARSMGGDNITAHGRDFAEAYARVPWVHTNLVAKDWERALDDLHVVRDRIDAIAKDTALTADARSTVVAAKSEITKLDAKIRAHDATAVADSKRLLNWFSTTLDKPMMTAWFGPRGGGAGTGDTKHMNK
jgi:hypothetical protein